MRIFGKVIVDASEYDELVRKNTACKSDSKMLREQVSDARANADALRSDLNQSNHALRTANATAEDNMKMLKDCRTELDASRDYTKKLEADVADTTTSKGKGVGVLLTDAPTKKPAKKKPVAKRRGGKK